MARWIRWGTGRGRVRTPSPGSIASWSTDHWPPRWGAASRQPDGGSMHTRRVLVTAAGGFIGHHLVKRLLVEGCWVRGADLEAPGYEPRARPEVDGVDLRRGA